MVSSTTKVELPWSNKKGELIFTSDILSNRLATQCETVIYTPDNNGRFTIDVPVGKVTVGIQEYISADVIGGNYYKQNLAR